MRHNFFGWFRMKTKAIMGEVDFEMSSQAKYWMFDEDTLLECRQEACNNRSSASRTAGGNQRVRKFACGYQGRKKTTASADNEELASMEPHTTMSPTTMSPEDQETLVHFHAHQIQKLIGPNAIFPLLTRGASVLSTAIMLFRKFYLSNSVLDFHPRHIAAASALLAVKTDCERNLPVSPTRSIARPFVSTAHYQFFDRCAIPLKFGVIRAIRAIIVVLAVIRGMCPK